MNDNITASFANVELEEVYTEDNTLNNPTMTDLQAFNNYMERAWELELEYNKRARMSDYL